MPIEEKNDNYWIGHMHAELEAIEKRGRDWHGNRGWANYAMAAGILVAVSSLINPAIGLIAGTFGLIAAIGAFVYRHDRNISDTRESNRAEVLRREIERLRKKSDPPPMKRDAN